jgi:hypothetical protein
MKKKKDHREHMIPIQVKENAKLGLEGQFRVSILLYANFCSCLLIPDFEQNIMSVNFEHAMNFLCMNIYVYLNNMNYF